jgi:hypothetical protein
MTYEYRMFGQTRPSRYVIILRAFRKDPRYLVFSMDTVTSLHFEAKTDTSRVKCKVRVCASLLPSVHLTGRYKERRQQRKISTNLVTKFDVRQKSGRIPLLNRNSPLRDSPYFARVDNPAWPLRLFSYSVYIVCSLLTRNEDRTKHVCTSVSVCGPQILRSCQNTHSTLSSRLQHSPFLCL